MGLKHTNVLFSYKENLEKRQFKDWLTSHISFLLPIQKYKGEIELLDDILTMTFSGKNNQISRIILRQNDLININNNFDNIFKFGLDRSLGLTFKPLILTFN